MPGTRALSNVSAWPGHALQYASVAVRVCGRMALIYMQVLFVSCCKLECSLLLCRLKYNGVYLLRSKYFSSSLEISTLYIVHTVAEDVSMHTYVCGGLRSQFLTPRPLPS